MCLISAFFLGLGLLALAGALLEWEIQFENRKARMLRAWLGDKGTRRYFIGVSAIPLLLSLAVLAIMWLT
jgi:hypothetical protein